MSHIHQEILLKQELHMRYLYFELTKYWHLLIISIPISITIYFTFSSILRGFCLCYPLLRLDRILSIFHQFLQMKSTFLHAWCYVFVHPHLSLLKHSTVINLPLLLLILEWLIYFPFKYSHYIFVGVQSFSIRKIWCLNINTKLHWGENINSLASSAQIQFWFINYIYYVSLKLWTSGIDLHQVVKYLFLFIWNGLFLKQIE